MISLTQRIAEITVIVIILALMGFVGYNEYHKIDEPEYSKLKCTLSHTEDETKYTLIGKSLYPRKENVIICDRF